MGSEIIDILTQSFKKNIVPFSENVSDVFFIPLTIKGSYVCLKIEPENDGYVISDMGYAFDLAVLNRESSIPPAFSEYLQKMYGVEISNNWLVIKSDRDGLFDAIVNIRDAMSDVIENYWESCLYEKALDTFGKANQIYVCIEELAELSYSLMDILLKTQLSDDIRQLHHLIRKLNDLIKQSMKYLRKNHGKHDVLLPIPPPSGVLEEIADVSIMISQLNHMFHALDDVQSIREKKLERLHERIIKKTNSAGDA